MNRTERRARAKARDTTRLAAARREKGNPIAIALQGASVLSAAEVKTIIAPAKDALERMRQGIGTLRDWQHLASAVNISKAIERQGIVRGLAGHLKAAESALAHIHKRAEDEADSPYPYALHLGEIEVLATAIELLFDYQLRQLSRRELRAAVTYAENEIRSTGGEVIDERPQPVQAALPLARHE